MRILVVEDEKDLNQILVKRLKAEGYGADGCFDGDAAIDYMEMTDYDLVLLDILLPGKSGMEVLRHVRAAGMETPILMLTARDSTEDKVQGLDAGADDYLTKPFAFEELMARVRMLLRKRSGRKSNLLSLADLRLDTGAHRVFRGDREIFLSAREFALLEYLMVNQGMVLTRAQIVEHLLDYDYEGASNLIDVYIRYLRKKISVLFGDSGRLVHRSTGLSALKKAQ